MKRLLAAVAASLTAGVFGLAVAASQPSETSRPPVLVDVAVAEQVRVQSAAAAPEAAPAPPPIPAPAADPCSAPTWVAAWSAPPQDSTAEQAPAAAPGDTGKPSQVFADQTLRMMLTPHASGSRVRLHLSNRFGRAPLTLGSVRVARRGEGAAVVAGSDRAVTFAGAPTVTIDPGATVVTDEIDLPAEPFADLAASFHVVGPSPLDVHLFGQQTQYATAAGTGDHTADPGGEAFTQRLGSTLVVSALDVLAPRRLGTVVALGDSITDGLGSTPDAHRRWPDLLARRLLSEPGAPPLTVVNAGIGGNQVSRDNVFAYAEVGWGMGPSTVTRLDADALTRAGVTDVVLFVGINDLYMPTGPDPVAAITAGYRAIVDRARSAGVRVIGATVTPGDLPADKEAQRAAVNDWIRNSGAFDAVVDFDAVVRDPTAPARVNPALAADPVHLNDAGYAALAAAIDLRMFQGTGC